MHTILEEREFVAHLAIKLATMQKNVSICAECPQAYSWVYTKLATSELDTIPEGTSYRKLFTIVDSLISYNLIHDEKIFLTFIDANLSNSSFVSSLIGYARYLSVNTIFTEYSLAFPNSNSETYVQSLQELQEILEERPGTLGFPTEGESIGILHRMVANEILSVSIRSGWNSDYAGSFNDRESLIKSNADFYLRTTSRVLIFYFGANHVQKGRFLGSQIEWLGDYMHHTNEISRGKTISIVGIPLQGEIINFPNAGVMQFDLLENSKEDDLLRILAGIQTLHFGWMPLEDSIFSSQDIRVQYIYDGNEIIAPPKKQYDAFITFSTGTFVGW